jgi:hypothetical protein
MVKIKVENKEIELMEGDVVFVSLAPNKFDILVKGRYIRSEGEKFVFSILNPKLQIEKVFLSQDRIIKIEKPN